MMIFSVSKSVDFSAQDRADYMQDSIEFIQKSFDVIGSTTDVVFTINELEMNDSIFDPFSLQTYGT